MVVVLKRTHKNHKKPSQHSKRDLNVKFSV
jgi:hypothetical protein